MMLECQFDPRRSVDRVVPTRLPLTPAVPLGQERLAVRHHALDRRLEVGRGGELRVGKVVPVILELDESGAGLASARFMSLVTPHGDLSRPRNEQ
jgi:hypothetical protein